jgi:thiamine-monophosphate kinase
MESKHTSVASIGEFQLIDRLVGRLGPGGDSDVVVGIGDDAAVLRQAGELLELVTVDALIEGVHFERSLTPLRHLGFKAISANVSDVCAMNGRPRFATISVGIPPSMSVEMMEAFYDGVREACDGYGLQIVGGDTTSAHQLSISVCVLGEVEPSRLARRSGASPGDLICVTGDLGAAYAGLRILLHERLQIAEQGAEYVPTLDAYRHVVDRQLAPRARLDVVNEWEAVDFVPSALIDISDGLASEVHHLCGQSACGALIREEAIPIHPETLAVAELFEESAFGFATSGGEDYELLFAMRTGDYQRLDDSTFHVVGVCTEAEEGVRMQQADGSVLSLRDAGYKHFGQNGAPD